MRNVPTLFLAALALSACEKDAPSTDDTDVVDTEVVDTEIADTEVADSDPVDTEVTADCRLDATLAPGALDWKARTPDLDAAGGAGAILGGELPGDVLQIELYAGFAPFEDAPETGTYDLAGTNYATCGLCVLVWADYDDASGEIGAVYLATAGTFTITEATHGLVGTLEDAVFEEVTIEPDTFESTVVGTCSASLASVTVEAYWAEADCTDGEDEDEDGLVDCEDTDDCGCR